MSRLDELSVRIIECTGGDYAGFVTDAKADAFIHLAWEGAALNFRDDVNLQWQNTKDTLGAVELAHCMGCKEFVFATSQAEVGRTDEPISNQTPCFPESAYGAAKLAAGQLSLLRCRQLGIRHCRVRILSVFSEHADDNAIINYVVRTLLKGEKPSLTPCEQSWDFMYVDDAADAILAVVERGLDGAIYSIGSGTEKRLREYIEQIRDMIGPELPLGFGEKPYFPHQPMRLVADVTNLVTDTGYLSDINSFGGGGEKVIEYYRKAFLLTQ
jgi:nucleoside-diphosphate-sugar epimerase